MPYIETVEGLKIRVDADDYKKLSEYKWRLGKYGPMTNVKISHNRFTTKTLMSLITGSSNKYNMKVHRNDDILDYRKSNIISLREQAELKNKLFRERNLTNQKHNTKFHGLSIIEDSGNKYYQMQFYLSSYLLDSRIDKKPERLALIHDKYSVLYKKNPLRLNNPIEIVKEELDRSKAGLKIVKYNVDDIVGVWFQDENGCMKCNGRVVNIKSNNRYDVMVTLSSGETRLLKNISVFDLSYGGFRGVISA